LADVHNPKRGREARKSLYAEALLHQCTTRPMHALPDGKQNERKITMTVIQIIPRDMLSLA
jgi:hypothetical protein